MDAANAELIISLQQLQLKLEKNMRDIQQMVTRQSLQTAHELSSGPFSEQDLTKLGHPFSRSKPQASVDPAVVNDNGSFKGNWHTTPQNESEDVISSQLVNDDPAADFLSKGTPNMVARPIVQRIEEIVSAQIETQAQKILDQLQV